MWNPYTAVSTQEQQTSSRVESPVASTSNRAKPKCQPDLATVSDEAWDLSDSFASMFATVVRLLSAILPVGTLKCYLDSLVHLEEGKPYFDPTLYNDCASTNDILCCLQTRYYIHPLHVRLLKSIVEHYGCDECKRLVKEYELKIPKSAPLKRSRNMLSAQAIELVASCGATKKLKVCTEGDFDSNNFQEVERIQQALQSATGVCSDVLNFVSQKPGSVILTFLVPATTKDAFRTMNEAILAASGILWITFNSVEVYKWYRDVPRLHVGMGSLSFGRSRGHVEPLKRVAQPPV